MATITRLNHVVLWVRDAQASKQFYQDVLGFQVVEEVMDGRGVFMRANGSDNHHDLGLFEIGPAPGPEPGRRVGMYHVAWELATIEDLVDARTALVNAGAFTGQSDHGASLSLYAADPDGNEFEVFWPVPKDEWETRGFGTRTLRLEEELAARAV